MQENDKKIQAENLSVYKLLHFFINVNLKLSSLPFPKIFEKTEKLIEIKRKKIK